MNNSNAKQIAEQVIEQGFWITKTIVMFPILTSTEYLNNTQGLCKTLFAAYDYTSLQLIFKTWPDFSGEPYYPISVVDNKSAELQYDLAAYNGEMNKGEYGQKRLDLYNYTAEILNEIILIHTAERLSNVSINNKESV